MFFIVCISCHVNRPGYSSPSVVEESHKIREKYRESLDQYLLDECCSPSDEMIQLVLRNERLLDDFGKRIRDLQEQGVERKSVGRMLLGCFVDVVNKVEHYYSAERNNLSGDTACSSLEGETSEMINEAVEKLDSVKCSTLIGGGSPLGNITLWSILFESCVDNLRLDRICEKHRETMKLGALSDSTVTNVQILDQLSASMDQLLIAGESVLVQFVAMHKTMAEITYMLGDSFTTGGAGMNEVLGSDASNDLLRENDKAMEMDLDLDFPWDKHNLPDEVQFDLNDPNMRWADYVCTDYYGPDDSDNDFS
ncbi:hypothetical protein MKW94_005614 [Papaver nudicaule]|uniref:Uncharacterized protein n=1 Tax=Papaver nudicaule TaxID=74823 RepID=A0AA41S0L4_PAPNU|nr:hypothetical protein [Papaver nudicaule]